MRLLVRKDVIHFVATVVEPVNADDVRLAAGRSQERLN